MLEGAMKQMLVRAHNLKLLDAAGSWCARSTRTRKQDSQHKLNQPRGSWPDTSNFSSLLLKESSAVQINEALCSLKLAHSPMTAAR